VAVLVWLGYEIVSNARDNLQSQRIASGFDFLGRSAGFDISQTLIPYSTTDTYLRVFFVGLLNTLEVSVIGIFFATLIGFIVALGRLSPNWLMARVAGAYVEIIRNLPVLFQILFWYLAVLGVLPNPRQSVSLFDSVFLNNRGLFIPRPVANPGLDPFAIAILVAIVGSLLLRSYARKQLFAQGRRIVIWPYVIGLLIGLPLLTVLVFGAPVSFEWPQLKGFNFSGGSRVIPEFVALTLALSLYTAAFIAEIVRSGIQSVHKGQMEAGTSLGLSRGATLRLIVIPQAMRVILPPLTSQYLNLAKNSSLAVAIGFPDLVSVFAGTTLSQTGQAVEIIAITMGAYLLISLIASAIMNVYAWRVNRSLGT
jgi:general L-amino acid transport system permease protein